jgi:uncharacterized protein with FMN-binding domain
MIFQTPFGQNRSFVCDEKGGLKESMKKAIIAVVSFLVVIALGGYLLFILPNETKLDSVRTMKIENVNLEKVSDGKYNGEYSYGSFTYKVEVSVKGHKIENIDIVSNRDTSYAKKAEGVIRTVLDKQSVDVDAVSGATTTSKALLKAIENALKSGLEQ